MDSSKENVEGTTPSSYASREASPAGGLPAADSVREGGKRMGVEDPSDSAAKRQKTGPESPLTTDPVGDNGNKRKTLDDADERDRSPKRQKTPPTDTNEAITPSEMSPAGAGFGPGDGNPEVTLPQDSQGGTLSVAQALTAEALALPDIPIEGLDRDETPSSSPLSSIPDELSEHSSSEGDTTDDDFEIGRRDRTRSPPIYLEPPHGTKRKRTDLWVDTGRPVKRIAAERLTGGDGDTTPRFARKRVEWDLGPRQQGSHYREGREGEPRLPPSSTLKSALKKRGGQLTLPPYTPKVPKTAAELGFETDSSGPFSPDSLFDEDEEPAAREQEPEQAAEDSVESIDDSLARYEAELDAVLSADAEEREQATEPRQDQMPPSQGPQPTAVQGSSAQGATAPVPTASASTVTGQPAPVQTVQVPTVAAAVPPRAVRSTTLQARHRYGRNVSSGTGQRGQGPLLRLDDKGRPIAQSGSGFL